MQRYTPFTLLLWSLTATAMSSLKRDNSHCSVQPSSDDTADAFLANTILSDAATGAIAPEGYVSEFINLQAAVSATSLPYLTFTTLSSYDVASCAKFCHSTTGCKSFNIYFERDPRMAPTTTCSNPSSRAIIKCALFAKPSTKSSATNTGQYQLDFHLVIAGSNAYNALPPVPGYSAPLYLNTRTIHAPLDCKGHNTYMGHQVFENHGAFDPNLCAQACADKTAYNLAHPDASGHSQMCRFFNTYVVPYGGKQAAQWCALYNVSWTAEQASVAQGVSSSYAYAQSSGGPATCM
ncbi:hypothetical protein EJ03DRAFT_304293 [Teratosphaeria nubilosa]|uniref:Apple domain-containing protein n=1 Tax=Teratosphaeria nubilosa TaxID=161662 RepID=A0A6G1LMX3_9PEZI|nr:hypothetical protein EJ03DRAFT_304293 [Teratosphaeria nubilosa]